MRYKDTEGRLILATKTVVEVMNEMPIGQHFYGWELQQLCAEKHPELSQMYVDTFLRIMRGKCKSQYILTSHSESLYQRVSPEMKRKFQEIKRYKKLKQQSFNFEGGN